jgi:hypothetical protein
MTEKEEPKKMAKMIDLADDVIDLIKAAAAIVLFSALGASVFKVLSWIFSLV